LSVHTGRRRWRAPRLTCQTQMPAPVPELALGKRPVVSVIITCYNYGRFLPDAVNSALSQERVEPEIIVVDDASTDGSADVAERLARSDARVTVIRHHSNTGQVEAFNDGLAAASGEFIVRLDADDLLTPGSLARSIALLDFFPHVGLVYGHPLHFTTEMPSQVRSKVCGWTVWSGEDWVAERCRRADCCITSPEAVIRGSVMRSVGGLSSTLRHTMDMELWLRIGVISDVGRVHGPDQAFHRDHPASWSVTDGGGQMVLLEERRSAFEVLFAGLGSQMRQAAELHRGARSALADEALAGACRAYDRGRTGSVDVQGYIDFALDTFPEARQLPHWRALQRRQRLGVRLAPIPPFFTATVIRRRLRWEISYRRWQRTGLW
jgi:hypothetical protein